MISKQDDYSEMVLLLMENWYYGYGLYDYFEIYEMDYVLYEENLKRYTLYNCK